MDTTKNFEDYVKSLKHSVNDRYLRVNISIVRLVKYHDGDIINIKDNIYQLSVGDDRLVYFEPTKKKYVLVHAFQSALDEIPEQEMIKVLDEIKQYKNGKNYH